MCREGCAPCDRIEKALPGERREPRSPVALLGGIGLALYGFPVVSDPAPRIVWNVSTSAPLGIWRVRSGLPIRRGDMVVVRLSPLFGDLAAARRYLPKGVPLLKRVVAQTGDDICARGNVVSVNGRRVALRQAFDRSGRPMPWWSGCEHLRDRWVFLLTDRPDSFDGRYFGPINQGAVIGTATPLWLV